MRKTGKDYWYTSVRKFIVTRMERLSSRSAFIWQKRPLHTSLHGFHQRTQCPIPEIIPGLLNTFWHRLNVMNLPIYGINPSRKYIPYISNKDEIRWVRKTLQNRDIIVKTPSFCHCSKVATCPILHKIQVKGRSSSSSIDISSRVLT